MRRERSEHAAPLSVDNFVDKCIALRQRAFAPFIKKGGSLRGGFLRHGSSSPLSKGVLTGSVREKASAKSSAGQFVV